MGKPAMTRQSGLPTNGERARKQRTPEWHAERRTGIGSSDAPTIAGVGWGDIHELWLQKLNLAPEPEQNEPMRWGRLLEDAVAEGYTEMSGNKLRRMNLVQRSREHPWMLASIDRAIVGRRRLVEIKTVRFKDDEWGAPGTDEVPDRIRVQVQHQMIVTGYREADVAVLFSGNDLKVYALGHDEFLAQGLIRLEAAFWQYVENRTPPPKVNPVAPLLRTDALPADARITALVAQLREDRARLADAKQVAGATEDLLRQAMADATLVRGDGFTVTYRPGKNIVKVAWEQVAKAYRHLLGEPYPELDTIQGLYTRTEAGKRPLLVKWKEQQQ